MSVLVDLGLVLLLGLVGGQLTARVRVPAVSGYLLMGLVAGPAALGLVSSQGLSRLAPVSGFALGLIAFLIGSEFDLGYLLQVGRRVTVITLVQGVASAVSVTLAVVAAGFPLSLGILLGGIAITTAHAATLAVAHEYGARGELTHTLHLVVALDDILAVLAFALLVPLAEVTRGRGVVFVEELAAPAWELLGSLAAGSSLGIGLAVLVTRLRRASALLISVTAVISLAVGLAGVLRVSPLLTPLIAGFVVGNRRGRRRRLPRVLVPFEGLVLAAFFVLVGASLDVRALGGLGLLGLVYLVARTLGKLGGAYLGAQLVSAGPNARRYLGLGLLPQAGVAVGMLTVAQARFPEFRAALGAVVLGAVVVYELAGPVLAKLALGRAGELARTRM